MTYQEVKDISDSCKKAELQFCNRPEEMVRHYRKLKKEGAPRTPLTAPFHTVELKKEHFERFCTFLDHLSEEERRDEILIAIKDIGKRIKHLPEGGNQSRRERDYEKMIESLQKKLEGTTDKSWDALRQSLIGEYIEEVSLSDFNHVMNHHHLPTKGKPITWIGRKVEGIRFYKHFGFKQKDFNKCFIHENGKPFLTNNATDTKPSEQFLKILNTA